MTFLRSGHPISVFSKAKWLSQTSFFNFKFGSINFEIFAFKVFFPSMAENHDFFDLRPFFWRHLRRYRHRLACGNSFRVIINKCQPILGSLKKSILFFSTSVKKIDLKMMPFLWVFSQLVTLGQCDTLEFCGGVQNLPSNTYFHFRRTVNFFEATRDRFFGRSGVFLGHFSPDSILSTPQNHGKIWNFVKFFFWKKIHTHQITPVLSFSYVVLRFWCHYLCASRVFCTFRENHFSHHLHMKFHLSASSCWAHRSTIFKSNFPSEKHFERFDIRVTIHCDPFFAFYGRFLSLHLRVFALCDKLHLSDFRLFCFENINKFIFFLPFFRRTQRTSCCFSHYSASK